jgi:hypothetical protein
MDTYGVNAASAGQLPFGLRTVDGTFNNLMIAPTGTPGTPAMIRERANMAPPTRCSRG